MKHNYIGTEHLLLGLLREEEGLGCRCLESFDITVEEVRAKILRIVGEGPEMQTGQIPFTPRAKKVLELGLREALSLGHNYIGTEHVLLGLVRENEGVGAAILDEFGATPRLVHDWIVRSLSRPQRPAAPAPTPNPLIEIFEAAKAMLPYLQLSTEPDRPTVSLETELGPLVSPAKELRQQAEEIEKKDQVITRFRAALAAFGKF